MGDADGSAPGGQPPRGGNSDDEPDETLKERLWGLTEMLPEETMETVVNGADSAGKIITRVYKFLRTTSWIIVSSTLILLAPIVIEIQRLQYKSMLQEGAFGPCVSRGKKQGGGYPCQPFRPHP